MASRGRSRRNASPQYSHTAKRKAYQDALSPESEELSDLDQDAYHAPKRPPYKRPKPYQSPTKAESGDEMDVDVENVSRSPREDEEAPVDNAHGDSDGGQRPQTSKSKPTKKSSGGGKKRAAVVWSDEEDEAEGSAPYKPSTRTPEPDDDDEKYSPEPSAKLSKAKNKPTLPKIPKKKNTQKDSTEIQMKDERKTKSTTSRQEPRKRTSKDEEEDEYVSPLGSPSVDIDVTDDKPAKEPPPPPQSNKKKLPPIRKNKPPTEPASKPSTSHLATLVRASPITDNLGSIGKTTAAARKPTLGAADLDLTNASVYASLFKSTGGNTPRSGINRRERDEERSKELNKQREEAKARRAQEAKVSFSLQTQQDKIARWEERFRANKSCVLFPNYIAAKFREEYEQERRREEREANGDRERAN